MKVNAERRRTEPVEDGRGKGDGERTAGFMIRTAVLIALFLPLLVPAVSLALEPPPVFDRVEELRLENGMLFLLLPRHDVPSVSGRIRVRVGNVDNPTGQTGLAHMFEHMAFKGTDRIGTHDWEAERIILDSVAAAGEAHCREMGLRERGDPEKAERLHAELNRLVEKQAELTIFMDFTKTLDTYALYWNAWTNVDFTQYETDVPANHLEAWMLMESERLQHPVFREFYPERDVVIEERRERTEDNPNGLAWELFYSLAFTAHPYRFPTIGYMSDLETLSQRNAERFFETYYVPNNMTAALVGDFNLEETKRLIEAYFGDMPPGIPPPEVTTVEPVPRGIRRGVVREGTERSVKICFPGFSCRHRDAVVAEYLSAVLSRDNTSRLNRRLDLEEKAVLRVFTSPDGGFKRYPGVFEISVSLMEGFTNEIVEEMIWEELERVITEPVSDAKVDEIRRSLRKEYYYDIETNGDLAGELVSYQTVHADWRRSYRRFEDHETVTSEEITRLASDLFRRDLATVVYLEPEATSESGEEGGDR